MLMSTLMSLYLLLAPVAGMSDSQPKAKIYQVEMRCYQTESHQGSVTKEIKVLSNPTLTMLGGRQSKFIVGGEEPIPHTKPVEFAENGLIITMTPTTLDEKSCTIQLNAQSISVEAQSSELLIQSGSMVKLRGKIELNKKMTVRVGGKDEGKQTWLDFTISEHRQ